MCKEKLGDELFSWKRNIFLEKKNLLGKRKIWEEKLLSIE